MKTFRLIALIVSCAIVNLAIAKTAVISLGEYYSQGDIGIDISSDSVIDTIAFSNGIKLAEFWHSSFYDNSRSDEIGIWFFDSQMVQIGYKHNDSSSIDTDTSWALAVRYPDSLNTMDTSYLSYRDTIKRLGKIFFVNIPSGLTRCFDYGAPIDIFNSIIYINCKDIRRLKIQVYKYELSGLAYSECSSFGPTKMSKMYIRWATDSLGNGNFERFSNIAVKSNPLNVLKDRISNLIIFNNSAIIQLSNYLYNIKGQKIIGYKSTLKCLEKCNQKLK